MHTEKIKVRLTQTGKLVEVSVLSKHADHIEIILGEGIHSVRGHLTPTRNGQAYAGNVMGRELVYECSHEQVQADINKLNPHVNKNKR